MEEILICFQFDNLKEMSIADLSSRSKRRNRMAVRSLYDNRIDVTVQDDQGHLKPVTSYLKSNI
jgi:hypothetical protein